MFFLSKKSLISEIYKNISRRFNLSIDEFRFMFSLRFLFCISFIYVRIFSGCLRVSNGITMVRFNCILLLFSFDWFFCLYFVFSRRFTDSLWTIDCTIPFKLYVLLEFFLCRKCRRLCLLHSRFNSQLRQNWGETNCLYRTQNRNSVLTTIHSLLLFIFGLFAASRKMISFIS